MTATVHERVSHLESSLRQLEERIDRLEGTPLASAEYDPLEEAPEPVAWKRVPEPDRPLEAAEPQWGQYLEAPVERSQKPVVPRASFEDVLAGRVFAWVGGLAVVLAAMFFVVTAVRQGWIDEPTRIALAFAGSALLFGVGVLLHELKGQTQAARALVASGIASAYLALVAATQVYGLIALVASFAVASVIAAASMLIAVRWRSRLVAGIGICGALLAPILVGSGVGLAAVAFMGIALVAGVGVLVWCAWSWLAVMTFVISAPQLLWWIFGSDVDLAVGLPVLAIFWVLYLVGAVGFELRVRTARLRVSSAILVGLDATLVTAAGWVLLDDRGYTDAATGWVLAFAAAHMAIGIASQRSARINPSLGATMITLGLVYSAVGLALALDGAVLVFGWSVEAAAVAFVGSRRRAAAVSDLALGFLALAVVHTLLFDARPEDLAVQPAAMREGVLALVVVAAASVALALLRPEDDPWLRRGGWSARRFGLRTELLVLALAAVLYLLAFALEGVALVAAWSAVAVALGAGGRALHTRLAFVAALGTVALAIGHGLFCEAPPQGLFVGVDDLQAAVLAIAAVTVALGALAVLLPPDMDLVPVGPGASGSPHGRWQILAAAAVALLYLFSIVIVERWGVTATGERREGGQFALSLLWAAVGLMAFVIGLLRGIAALRHAGLALLVVAVTKVFVYDLTELTSLARVASLLVIGLVLIAGAYFYQRIRPGSPGHLGSH